MFHHFKRNALQKVSLATKNQYEQLFCWKTLLFCLCLGACTSKKKEVTAPIDTLPLVSIDAISVEEGDVTRNIDLVLRLSTSSTQVVSLKLNSENGTANAYEDFEVVEDQEVIFAPGTLEQTFTLTILGDEKFEASESFSLKISDVKNAYIGQANGIITLLTDDDNDQLIIPTTGFVSPTSYPDRQLIWQDEFNSSQDLSEFWTFETGNNGWGNNELQFYLKENTYLQENHLVIEARKENHGGSLYTSSRMISKDKFDFQYGRVDIRAVLPYGQGIWPALWMLGDNIFTAGWPQCGEIDIMEVVGHQPNTLHGTAHWSNQGGSHSYVGGSTTLATGSFSDQFHVFSIIWREDKIEWLLDDQPYYELAITANEFSEFHNNFFLIFNVAIGGNWPGNPDASTVFPQYLLVDYIRVFQ
ncbi:MAG: family 16 glycosylhydrolase [Saprospiraceae bacterium]